MKAPSFAYARPESIDKAVALLSQYGDEAKILAGGQSLMATLNMRLSAPELLIDINCIDTLSGINLDGETLKIGALTRQVDVERSPLVAQHAPLLTLAMPHIAHPAIRNRGTFGGSVAFADPAAELPACVVALDADLVLQGKNGERKIPAKEFFRGLYETALAEDEILVSIEIPVASANTRAAFKELARRHGDYAIIGLAANSQWQNDEMSELRLVFFSAGDQPVVARETAKLLLGAPSEGKIESAMDQLVQELDPPEDLSASSTMRLHLAKVLTRRVMKELNDAG
ncbi:FAD binding domain-containing protein [Pseudomonadota bacterium]